MPSTAFKTCGLDASIQYFEAMGQFWIPNAEKYIVQTPEWREEIEIVQDDPDDKLLYHTITTPGGHSPTRLAVTARRPGSQNISSRNMRMWS